MSRLEVRGVSKRFGRVAALAGVDLTVAGGTLTAVLGPSGCGKTTLLRCVAGFERVDAGEILVDGRLVADGRSTMPPQRRGIAVVPQEGALFPHLSVRDNIGYGLGRGPTRAARIDEVLELVGLAGLGDRMPHQLSGGQQQRVAVARALAPRPTLVLLDEPFSALDAALRAELRTDIRAALHAAAATAIIVTHDQSEALSLADHVAVMRDGVVLQTGTPATVYGEPADPWIAAFIGDAVLLMATVDNGRANTALGVLPVTGWPGGCAGGTVMVRPEQIRVGPPTDDVALATVEARRFYGHDAVLGLRLADGTQVIARILGTAPYPIGAKVALQVDGPVRAWPDRGERRPVGSVTASRGDGA